MFAFTRKGDEDWDPEKMTVREIAELMRKTLEEPDLKKMLNNFTVTKEQQAAVLDIAEKFVLHDKRATAVTKDSILGFKYGILYGMALQGKLMMGISGDDSQKKTVETLKKFVFTFWALDASIDDWDETKWFENLMKNAKISEPNKKVKNGTTATVKDGRKKKKGII